MLVELTQPGGSEDIGSVLGDGAPGSRGGRANAGDLAPEPDMLGSQADGGCDAGGGAARSQEGGYLIPRVRSGSVPGQSARVTQCGGGSQVTGSVMPCRVRLASACWRRKTRRGRGAP